MKVTRTVLKVGVATTFVLGTIYPMTTMAAPSESKTVITFWNRQPELLPALNATIKGFEKQHPNIQVKVTTDVTNYNTELQAAISGNSLPDIFATITSMPLSQLVQLGLIRNINSVIPKSERGKFYPGTWSEGFTTMNGNIYVLPEYTGRRFANEMFYNLNVLKKAGLTAKDVPKTWSQFINVGKKIYAATKGKSYGLIVGTKTNWELAGDIMQMATAISPDVADNNISGMNGMNLKTGQYEFNSPGVVQTEEFLKSLLADKVMNPDSRTIDYTQAEALFAAGKAAFTFDGTFLTSELIAQGFKNFGVAPLPTKTGKPQYLAYQGQVPAGIVVSNHTQHYPQVEQFLTYMTQHFYKYLIQDGIENSPVPAINVSTKPGSPQFKRAMQIQDSEFVLSPNPFERNPQTLDVYNNLMSNAPQTDPGIILQGYLSGQITNVSQALTQLNGQWNQAFSAAIKAAQQKGDKVTSADWAFSNWKPFRPYNASAYKKLHG